MYQFTIQLIRYYSSDKHLDQLLIHPVWLTIQSSSNIISSKNTKPNYAYLDWFNLPYLSSFLSYSITSTLYLFRWIGLLVTTTPPSLPYLLHWWTLISTISVLSMNCTMVSSRANPINLVNPTNPTNPELPSTYCTTLSVYYPKI